MLGIIVGAAAVLAVATIVQDALLYYLWEFQVYQGLLVPQLEIMGYVAALVQ
jgi:hypothetical protein